MNSNNVRVVKKNINGHEIYMEVCDEGEFTTVNPKCYDNQNRGNKYSIKDMLLLLLGVDADIPLKKILLMKEAFLFEKELSYDLHLSFEPLNFIPYKYGSYSKLIDETLVEMEDLLIIDNSSRKFEIKLNDEGKKEAEQLIDTLPIDIINKIKFTRIGWDQLGTKGILKRVYIDYPVYVVNCEIKDGILGDK